MSISAPEMEQKTCFMKQIMSNSKSVTKLFKDMIIFGRSAEVNDTKSNLLSLATIVLFIEKGALPELSLHYKGKVDVVKEAFYYVVGYSKKIRMEISLSKFPYFLFSLFMFSHLWEVSLDFLPKLKINALQLRFYSIDICSC